MKYERSVVKKYILMEFLANKGRFYFDDPKIVKVFYRLLPIKNKRIELPKGYNWKCYNSFTCLFPPKIVQETDVGSVSISSRYEIESNWMIDTNACPIVYTIKTAMDFINIFSKPDSRFKISFNGKKSIPLEQAGSLIYKDIKRVEFRKTMIKIIV